MKLRRQQYVGWNSVLLALIVVTVNKIVESRVHVRERGTQIGQVPLLAIERDTTAAVISNERPFLRSMVRRDIAADNSKLLVNFTVLPDEAHNEAIVHWSGNDSQVIFLLTRQRSSNGTVVSSTLYMSHDYGSSFQRKDFDASVILFYFYVCPNNRSKLVFVDLKNKFLHLTKDEGRTFQMRPMKADADRIVFHPTQEDWFLSYSEAERTLYLSKDFGENWILVHEKVNPRFYWAVLPSVDKDKNLIHMEVEDPATGEFLYRAVTSPYPKEVVIDRHLGFVEVGSVVVQNEYIFAQRKTSFSSHLYVSYKRGPFKRTYFPRDARPTDFEVVDTDDHQVFIAANHKEGAVTLYLSDASGRFFVKSLENVMALSQPENFKVDLYEVKGLPGTYFANCIGPTMPETFITFNQGGKWQKIPAPEKFDNESPTNCRLPDCSLYIHLHIDSYVYGIPAPLTEENAPGLILAHGVIGKDARQTKFVMSTDGGVNWKAVMNGTYRRSILDQGGAIIAVPFNPTTLDTTEILYSCTEGQSWQKFTFNGQNIKVDGLLNEPGITTLIASLYGHTTAKDEAKAGWTVVKLDFTKILSNPCKPSDYKCWHPYDGQCLMGQRSCYERRLAEVECFNGGDYERAINVTSCSCSADDYECDYGHEPKGDKCEPASWFDPSVPVDDCEVGTTFQNSSGYRKVASSKCVGNEQHVATNATCPFIRPRGLQIQVDGSEFQSQKTNVTFLIYQEKGTRQQTNYTIDFGDGTPALCRVGIRAVEKVVHVFEKNGRYLVTARAYNVMGIISAAVQVSVQDALIGLHVSISHAAEIGKPVVFQAVPLFRLAVAPLSYQNVHYLWLFGTENGSQNGGQLLWNSTTTHVYAEPGNYTVWIQAFSGVGSVYRTITVPVFGTVTTVQLTLSGILFPFGSVSTVFEDVVAETLRKTLAFELGISLNRLDVELSQQMAPVAFVSFLPLQQTMTKDDSVKVLVDQLFEKVKSKKITFSLPDEAFGSRSNITVVSASLVSSGNGASSIVTNPVLGIAIGLPLFIVAVLVSVLVAVYYKRRASNHRSYSLLSSRYRAGESLLEDTDDDDPLLIDSLSPGGAGGGGGSSTGGSGHQRLTISDDEDLLGTQILLSNADRRLPSVDREGSGRIPVSC